MKPRNPFVVHAIKRKAGKHMKTNKAKRNQENIQVKKNLSSLDKLDRSFIFLFKQF